MKRIYKIAALLIIGVVASFNNTIYAQNVKSSANKTSFPFHCNTYNFSTFTLRYTTLSQDWILHNQEYIHHPDAGFLTKDNPENAIELLAKRTNDSRYFIDKDTAAKFYLIKSNIDINYQKDGQWLTIDTRLSPQNKNTYEASHQQEPVGFDMDKKAAYIKTVSGQVYFNDWILIGQTGNEQTVLATADWSHFSAGDDGIKITDVFPGIDAEMIVDRGSIKTNFIVRQNLFKGYTQLLFTDEFKAPGESALAFSDTYAGSAGGVDLLLGQKAVLHINSAIMYVADKPATTTEPVNYNISGDHLSLLVERDSLDRMLATGTVLIDPQVNSTDSLPVSSIGGSMNSGNPNLTCNYNLVMNTPAKATLTSIAFQFGFNAIAPATNSMGHLEIVVANGGCNTGSIGANPADSNYFKSGYASTMGNWAGISDLLPCMPAPACVPQQVTFAMEFYNTAPFGPNGVCSNQYVNAHEPFKILIQGYTLQLFDISPPVSICQGTNTGLFADGVYGVPPYTYNWNNGGGSGNTITVSPASTTNYTVTITDQCGNTATGSTLVTVIPQVTPTVSISASDTSICQGVPVTFSAVAGGGGSNPIYQWKLNGNNVGANSSTYTNSTLNNGDQVYCVLTSNANCLSAPTAVSDTITMLVITPVTPSVTITASANNICAEIPVTFSAIPLNAGSSPSYQWQVDGINAGPNDSLYTTNSLANGDIIDCIVSVSNIGCYTSPSTTSNSITMDIMPVPGIVLTAADTIIAKGDNTKLTAIITGGYTSYTWSPITGLSDFTVTDPVVSPIISTDYKLAVTDTDGCVKSDSILIAVYDKIFIPSAFSPNGDGLNDLFRVPPTIDFTLTKFAVYNRWGAKIFETSDITQGWDGTFQGNPCDVGSYVYIITGSNAKGNVFVKGHVILFR